MLVLDLRPIIGSIPHAFSVAGRSYTFWPSGGLAQLDIRDRQILTGRDGKPERDPELVRSYNEQRAWSAMLTFRHPERGEINLVWSTYPGDARWNRMAIIGERGSYGNDFDDTLTMTADPYIDAIRHQVERALEDLRTMARSSTTKI